MNMTMPRHSGPRSKHVAIAGAGFSGAVIGRALAEAGHKVTIFEERDHVAGNCHTTRDAATGVMVHVYGPHIFHTDNAEVWSYIQSFGTMMPYVNRVKAVARDQVFSLPINLHTINQLFGTTMRPDEARAFIAEKSRSDIDTPASFEDQALKFVGDEIYRTFFYGYTRKQWGVEPTSLPASILKRLPLRFNYDDNYFNHRYQAIPRDGYTAIIEAILDVPGLEVQLETPFETRHKADFDHIVYSGPIDRYFDHAHGRLRYRTLRFERFDYEGDYQGNPVVNYCDEAVPFTRISEHKHFAPWEDRTDGPSVCFREFSSECEPGDVPFYPMRLLDDKERLNTYIAQAEREDNVTFVGRLGTYSYLDMDVTIARAMETVSTLMGAWDAGAAAPALVHGT